MQQKQYTSKAHRQSLIPKANLPRARGRVTRAHEITRDARGRRGRRCARPRRCAPVRAYARIDAFVYQGTRWLVVPWPTEFAVRPWPTRDQAKNMFVT